MLLTLIQVVQQHRGLSAAVIGGVENLRAKREAKEIEVQQAIAAVTRATTEHGVSLKAADAALYRAKEQGRNRVVVAA